MKHQDPPVLYKRILWPPVLIGILALALGILFYLLERPASHTYFVPEAASLYDQDISWFGVIGNYLPDFLHAFAFCLLTIGVLGGGKRVIQLTCLSWLLIESLFELGQQETVANAIVPIIPKWFDQIPLLENTAAFFTTGRFDPLDLLAFFLGVSVAYALSHWQWAQ